MEPSEREELLRRLRTMQRYAERSRHNGRPAYFAVLFDAIARVIPKDAPTHE